MKRISVALGRIGAVLLAVCAALTILVFIPSANVGISIDETYHLEPETLILSGSQVSSFNPQVSVRVRLDTNTTIELYIINVRPDILLEAIGYYNLTKFDEFKQKNTDKILLDEEINEGSTTLEYTPSGLVNASFIIVNRNPHAASISCKIELLTSLAPKVRIISTTTYLAPIGAVLTGQWIFTELKDRKRETTA